MLGACPESITSATAAPSYLFGVFKSTADGSSLDHIKSTTTLRRGRSTVGRQSCVASPSRSAIIPRPDPRRRNDSIVEVTTASSASYSSVMLSDPPPTPNRNHQRTIVIGDQDSGPQEHHNKSSEKGSVHRCPHCYKGFYRPSSLQIHANTHTGARRKVNSFFVGGHFVHVCPLPSIPMPPPKLWPRIQRQLKHAPSLP